MSGITIPDDYVFEETDKSAFVVDPVTPLWISIPIFVVMLPLTTFCMFVTLILASIIIPVYRRQSIERRDKLSRVVMFWLMSTARFRINVVDYNKDESEHAQLYVSPHICMLEAMMMIYSIGHIRPMTADFTRNIPVFGIFVHASDPIYVMRGKQKNKISVVEQLRESVETTEYRHLIFPEGTFTNGKSLIQFKSGAFAVGRPVTPMLFHYPQYTPFWNREESSFFAQVYRIVSRFYTSVTIEYLPTYTPSQEELGNPKLYAENIRKLIAYHSKKPMSAQSLVDSPNYRKDKKKKS
jgi:lysophosphatidylcholine acyltransferase / lyso-PAF acetyltransferase